MCSSWAHAEKHIGSCHLPGDMKVGPNGVVCQWKKLNKEGTICGEKFATVAECLNHCTSKDSQHMALIANRCPYVGESIPSRYSYDMS